MWHYSVHFFAGFIETSSISFLSIFYLSVGYAVGAATAMLASFRLGNAILQLPLGWLVDKKSPLFSFALVGFVLLVCSTTLLFSLPIWMNAAIVFIFGGCVGGLNTLAVLDAGAKGEHGQISTAMTFIAIFYTAGSVIGPIATGWVVSYLTKFGLPVIIIIFISLFLFFLLAQKTPQKAN